MAGVVDEGSFAKGNLKFVVHFFFVLMALESRPASPALLDCHFEGPFFHEIQVDASKVFATFKQHFGIFLIWLNEIEPSLVQGAFNPSVRPSGRQENPEKITN